MEDKTHDDILDRLDKLEAKMIESNDSSEKLAERILPFLDNFDGFVKTIYTLGRFVFIFGILWAIFGDKIMTIVGG